MFRFLAGGGYKGLAAAAPLAAGYAAAPTFHDRAREQAVLCHAGHGEKQKAGRHATIDFGGRARGDRKDSSDFAYLTYDKLPPFTDKHRSLMSKVLTPELFNQLKNKKSNTGFTLSNAIQTGVETPHLGVGAVAGDEDCYEVFKELYNPIIKGWHGYDPELGSHPTDLNPAHVKQTPQQLKKFNQYVASTRIRAARNIRGYPLPPGSTAESAKQVEKILKDTFAGLEGELKGTYYDLGKMTPEQEASLQDEGFLFQKPKTSNLLTNAGAARFWPDSRGIFHNDAKTALCWCNEEDHCRIISMSQDGDVKDVFRRFCALSDSMKASAERAGASLMHSDKLGFIGTCPSNLGTGLRASVMICLPELNKDVDLLEKVCDTFDLQPRGSAGEHSAAVGAKWDISNKQRIGFSEVELVQKMIDGVTKVITVEEKLAQGWTREDVETYLLSEPPTPTKDGFKVVVVGGAGGIGQPLALLMSMDPLVTELVIIDLNIAMVPACGVAADLSHLEGACKVSSLALTVNEDKAIDKAGEALKDADLVLVPAGVPRKPGQDRKDLLNTNAGIAKGTVEAVAKHAPNAVVGLIVNPVNSVVPAMCELWKKAGLDPAKIVGISTLDVVRANKFVQEITGQAAEVPVIGGHAGKTILPLFSQDDAGRKVLASEIPALDVRVQDAGTEVVKAKNGRGSATLSMAYAGARLGKAVLRGLNGEEATECAYVMSSVQHGLPYFASKVTFGKNGVKQVHPVGELSEHERKRLSELVPILKEEIDAGLDYARENSFAK